MLVTCFFLLVTFFAILTNGSVQNQPDIIVKTANGAIRGLLIKTRKNRDVLAFYGVRYAEPPIGENRFKPPIAVKLWRDIYNATQPGQACMQSNPDSSYTSVSEDCLLLDIYAPSVLRRPKPVIVFIHGGGFIFGAKSDVSHEYLLDKDVVLVSLNYRLGPFGFLATGTSHASGNWAFKDQTLALKWIRRNIRAFGGDPMLVTLAGHSAGSFSVTAHLASPLSNGLFQRAIAMSGSLLGPVISTTLESTRILLDRSNCNDKNLDVALKCLRKLSAASILAAVQDEISPPGWFYVVEDEGSDEPFLTEDPIVVAKKGQLNRVPLMTGVNVDEFFSTMYDLYTNRSELIAMLNGNFNRIAPLMFNYKDHPNRNEISTKFRKFYLNNEPITADNIERLGELHSDSLIAFGVHRLMQFVRQNDKVFYYRFDYQGRYSHAYKPSGEPLGVIHGDELQYVFVFKKIAPVISVNDPENIIIERMTSWWEQFAKNGDPNDRNNIWTNGVMWKVTNRNCVRSFYINRTSIMSSSEHNADRYALWDSLLSL